MNFLQTVAAVIFGLYAVAGNIYAVYAYFTTDLVWSPYSLILRALFWPFYVIEDM